MGRAKRNLHRNNVPTKKPIEDLLVIEQLESWMESLGWTPSCHLKPTIFPVTQRGLKAVNNIPPNTPLVKIPKKLLITPLVALNSKINFIFLKNHSYTAHSILATFILYEKHLGNTSSWKFYLDTLPNSYTTPIFCAKIEKNIMPLIVRQKLSILSQKIISDYEIILKSIRELKTDGYDLCPHCKLPLIEIFSFEAYKWSYYTVNTRAIYMKNNKFTDDSKISINENLALAPFLDMLNHSFDALVEIKPIHDESNKFYQIFTLTAIQENSQVFINYGSHSTLKLYMEYGFFIPNNPLDEILINYSSINNLKNISKLTNNYILWNKFDESIGFTSSGLNYHAKIAFFILSAPLKISQITKKIYRNSLNRQDALSYNVLSLKLLNTKRLELINELKIMKSQTNKTNSFKIIVNVQQEYISILDKCFYSIIHN
ncbi:SET domain-containing protein 4-like [Cotesia typhae]|uniref:SET domain-containing protein 4-like n=1 Tax=Cotesia typhae TaxID=2053667 RepID=UPI003D69A036